MKLLGSIWVLGFIGACLSAVAFMFAMSAIPKAAKHMKKSSSKATSGELHGQSVFWNFRTKEIENLAASLKEELKRIMVQKNAMQETQLKIDAEKQEIARLKKEVELLNNELDDRIVLIERSELKNLKMLATAYSNMTPEDSIKILDGMNDLLTVKILALMKPEPIGAVFQQMAISDDPRLLKKAAYLTERLRLYNLEIDPNKK